jgi:protein disulfide-isomerase
MTEGAKPGVWTADFEAAQKAATQKGSPILVFFTGSDWNRMAQDVTKAVFAKPGWDKFAKDNDLFLVWVDLPDNTAPAPEKFAAQHTELRKAYLVKGVYPACVLLASDGIVKLTGFDKTLGDATLKSLVDEIKPHFAK